ncbi:MAG: HD domain-containing phosphohydrolase, partial [Pseudomonadota bacterium]
KSIRQHMPMKRNLEKDIMVRRHGEARILVVDDEEAIRNLLAIQLSTDGYVCSTASGGEEAQRLLESNEFHLVLSDINMPGMSGIELLSVITRRYPNTAVLMATAVDDRDTATRALELGAYGYLIKPFGMNDVLNNVANALERRRLTLLSQEYERELEAEVRERTRQVREREEEVVFRLLSSMGFRDDETGAHARRIGLYAALMARGLGWKQEEVDKILLAAPMHDLGKIGINDAILRKPGRLTAEEFEEMKKHTTIGAKILRGSEVPLIRLAEEIALSHHEKWDGSGYPQGLAGDAIPPSGRITAVADVYDALVHKRVYKEAYPEEKALAVLEEGRGRHFCPEVVTVFMNMHPEMRRIRKEVKDGMEPGEAFKPYFPRIMTAMELEG